MANNSDDIRRLMNLMESYQQPTLLEGWVDRLKDKMDRRLGEKERVKMAAELTKEYYTWLGHSSREGTEDDLVRFMTHRVGFNDNDVQTVLQNSGLSEPGEEPEDQGDEEGEEEQAPAPEEPAQEKKPAWDPEEGVPIPQDLNTKLNDYKNLGNGLEGTTADDQMDAGEVKDDPKKYIQSDGSWDNTKIRAKLDKMPMGAKLTLGKSTFRRTTGKTATPHFIDPKSKMESINERAANPDVIDRKTIKQVMDAVAAQVNDEYLYNGPERDRDGMGGSTRTGRSGTTGSNDQGSPNEPGKAQSGQYNAKEMFNILKTDFQKGPAWVDSITRKVMQANSISAMTDSDMQDLALLGWALVRARN